MAIFYLAPWLLSLIALLLAYLLGFTHTIENFDKMLDAVLTFSSIILGFLAALLGILITIRDTSIIKSLFSNGYKGAIKRAFIEPLTSGLAVVLLTTTFYLYLNVNTFTINIIFYTWLFVLCFFVLTSYRLISILIRILFKSDLERVSEADENERKTSDQNIDIEKIPVKDVEAKRNYKQNVNKIDYD